MNLGLAFLGMLLLIIGMFLVTLSLKRRDNMAIIMIGPIPIIVSGDKPYLLGIPIIVIIAIVLLVLLL